MLYIKHPVLNLHVMLLILEKRRLDLRVKEHGDKNDNCCIFRHSVDAGHAMVDSNDFKIIATGNKNTHTRK